MQRRFSSEVGYATPTTVSSYMNTPKDSQNSKTALSASQYEVRVGKHNYRQHASPHHVVATDVNQMPIRPNTLLFVASSPETWYNTQG